jgi:hypothetical protein
MRPRFLSLALCLFALPLAAQDLSRFEKFLVPVLNQSHPIVGANGSEFATTFGTYGFGRFDYYPAPGVAGPAIGQNIDQIVELQLWDAPVVSKGRFVFIDAGGRSGTLFAGLAAKAPNGSLAETPLPVVSERAALTGKSTFGRLPNNPTYGPPDGTTYPTFTGYSQRHTLRVYDFTGSGPLEVAVRLRYNNFIALDAREIRVTVNQRDFNDPSYPYYTELNLASAFGNAWCFPGLHLACVGFQAIVEVEPVTPAARYYAFISTTDNATNHVAIYTPR